MIHLFPHWNWDSSVDTVEVWAFSNAAEVELFLNNESLGRQPSGNYAHAAWPTVKNTPGNLYAVAYDANNKTIANQRIETTSDPVALRISVKDGVGADGLVAGCKDVALIQVEVVDVQGRVVPIANDNITFSISSSQGDGNDVLAYLGGGNGDPSEHTPDKSAVRPAFGGLVLGVFSSTATPGTVKVTASSPGLQADSLEITTKANTGPATWWCAGYEEL